MKIENPIKDNRIVSDITFATRLLHFIETVQVSDMASEEEKGYLIHVARKLQFYQLATCKSDEEKAYFKNLKLL